MEKDVLFENALGKNAVTNSLLRFSREGRYTPRWKYLLEASAECARSGRTEPMVKAALSVMECGNTSGADSLVGFLLGISKDVIKCT